MDPRAEADLARSGLTPQDINAEEPPPNHITTAPGYIIPYHLLNGQRHPVMQRTKLYTPRDDGAKYIQPTGITYPYFAPKVDWLKLRSAKYKLIVHGE